MKTKLAGLLTGLALLAPAAAHAAGPANVTVRVEGVEQTLVPQTRVTTTTTPVNKTGNPGEECSGTSGLGALEVATGGDWSGSWFGAGFGYSVERIRTESHTFPDPNFFSFWLNRKESQLGLCGVELQEGDEVLIFVDRCDYDPEQDRCANERVLPLGIEAPARATPGAAVDVKVVEYALDGTPHPAAGATVSGGDAAATTGADGVARVTLSARGERLLSATKANRAKSETDPVCVSDGADGFCGTAKPGEPAPPPAPGAPANPVTAPDRLAPQARILGITDKQRFTRAAFPRELRGSVSADPSGLHMVKLRITRRHRGRCWYFSPKVDGFRRTRCGRGFYFRIGDRADWSYLLPDALPGRFVVDVVAIDKAFNRDALARGRNRVVFTAG